MKPRPIIIDTDPGQDDAVAILMALASPELNVLGITAVAGNVPLEKTQCNARRIIELAGRTDIPVFAGCDRPLKVALETAEYVHGESGLNGAHLPEPTIGLAPGHAVEYLKETLTHAAEAITLCPIGPLTNIATLLMEAPHLAPKIKEIVLMGGAWREGGNVTPVAEFNIYADPHAAALVFKAGIPVTMMPLDVTHKALVTRERLQAFAAMNNSIAPSLVGMLDYFNRYDTEIIGMKGAPLHDATVIGWLVAPELFSGPDCHVAIETESPLTRGMTVVDDRLRSGRKANTRVITDLKDDLFFTLLTQRLRTYK